MGIFSFLKKQEYRLSIEELRDFIDEHFITNSIKNQLKQTQNHLKSNTRTLQKTIQYLEKRHGDDIQEFLESIRHLISHYSIPQDLTQLKSTFKDFEETYDQFIVSRPYYQLVDIEPKPMKDITIRLKNLYQTMLQLQDIAQLHEVITYRRVVAKLHDFTTSYHEEQKIQKKLLRKKNEIKDIHEKIKQVQSKLEKNKESKTFEEAQKAQKKFKTLQKKLENQINSLSALLETSKKVFAKTYQTHFKEKTDPFKDMKLLDSFIVALTKTKNLRGKKKKLANDLSVFWDSNKTTLLKIQEEHAVQKKIVDKYGVLFNVKEWEYQIEHLKNKIKEYTKQIEEQSQILQFIDIDQKQKALETIIKKHKKIHVHILR